MYRAVLHLSVANFSDDQDKAKEIKNIKEVSTKANKEHNISGVLAYNKNKFFHVLEGEENSLSNLLHNIEKDARNKDTSVILDLEVDDKIYPDWEVIAAPSEKQSVLLGEFLRRSIDYLPLIEQSNHDTLEEFINDLFY